MGNCILYPSLIIMSNISTITETRRLPERQVVYSKSKAHHIAPRLGFHLYS